MSVEGPNSVGISRQSARQVVALGLVLLSVAVAGAALNGVTAAESQSSPIEVSDWTDLDDIRNDTDADYVLVNGLNETTPGYETVAGPNANGGKGFDPIGGFSGSFDGQGNSIANLTISRPNKNNVGVFGTTEPTVDITSVHIIGMDITGSSGTGGLAGRHFGTIRNVSASGSVTGGNAVGGLVGRNFENATVWNASASGSVIGSFFSVGGLVGSNSGDSMIRESSARGSVTGQAQQMGGLVGSNFGNATIRESSAHGSVNGSDFVGGLVGSNGEGTVSDSSASGAVNGSRFVGGLVGQNDGGTVSTSSASGAVNGSEVVGGLVGTNGISDGGIVSESFATGAVTGSSDMGGLVGRLGSDFLNPGQEAILRDSYYDTQTTGKQAAVGTIDEGNGTAELRGEVTGLPTSQMQGASAAQNMGALDFTNTWRVVTNPPGYPELRGLPDGPDPSLTAVFTITPEDPTAGEQLTLNAAPSVPESDIESYNWTLGDGTTATGKQITHTYTDSGQFTVELTVQDGTEVDTATETISVSPPSSLVEISDWTDLNDIRNDTDADYVLVNDLNKSTAGYNAVVLNQTATEFTESVFFDSGESRVNLTRTPVAALLSNNEGLNLTVVDSANGTIEREDSGSPSGVLVSYTTPTERFVGFSPIGSFSEPFSGSFDEQGSTIRDLLIDRPTGLYVGLFGFSEGTIEQVTLANATITGSDFVGGLVGSNGGTVSNSSASGDVTGISGSIGGLVGSNGGTVSNSSASGAVDGSGAVGGLVGDNFEGNVSDSSASGVVNGSRFVGGLVGVNDGTVSDSSASGVVNGSRFVGGLVGGQNEGAVSTSSASGAVNGSSDVGGLVGFNIDGSVSNSSASGAVIGSGFNVGGLVGYNFEGTVSNSLASGTVTGSEQVGGLVGSSDGAVSNSSASGTVTGSERYVGGLVGENFEGTVSNSSASGTVTGSDAVGGLVGVNSDGTVRESFATGAVTGSSNVGGLVGQLGSDFLNPGQEAILRDSYYDTQMTGKQAAVGTITEGNGTAELRGEVAGLPTSQMQGASAAQNMGALDFTNTWRVVTNPPGYPELRGLPDGPDSGPPNVTLSNLSIADQGDNATITKGNYDVSVELSHDGGPNGTVPMELTIGNATTNETITLNTSETTTVTFENATDGLSPGIYTVTVSAVSASVTGEVTLSVPVGDNPNPATDTDDDGLLEDTDGDGEFTIFDVQAFFVEFQSGPIQTNSALFNFDRSEDGAVNIFDVQALFLELAG